jgi:hypothetical protein
MDAGLSPSAPFAGKDQEYADDAGVPDPLLTMCRNVGSDQAISLPEKGPNF